MEVQPPCVGCYRRVQLIASSGGLEEYIEGYSFLYYLECGELVSLPHLQQALTDEEGEKVS